ncbi:MAG: radical SAM protein, partial [Chloroflexaceae bacterium]|nr:radical SAM protein [Chloroflexaceae bacterium]
MSIPGVALEGNQYAAIYPAASPADVERFLQKDTPSPQPSIPPDSVRALKILLVTPKGKLEEDTSQKPLFMMGIGVLVSVTPSQHQIELADEVFGDQINYRGNYDLVGITTRTMNATRAYDIADEFRRHGKRVILGGVHASFNYEEAIAHCDSVVIGEAENLWTTLLEDVANNQLKQFYRAQDFPPVTVALPVDYARIFAASKREKIDGRKSIPIYMTRGCPYTCTFCVTPNFTGKLYRMHTAETIQAQVQQARQVFFRESAYGKQPWFMFTDENFGVNKKRMWEILEALKECDIRFSTFISINFLEDPKTVKLLVEAGCVMALIGFESIKAERLEAYKKTRQNSAEKFSEIIRHCRKAGLNIQGNFLVDPASDTYEDMAAVAQFISENHLVMPIYSIMTPYPGTNLYHEYKEKGLIVD